MEMTTEDFNDRYTLTVCLEATHKAVLHTETSEDTYLDIGQTESTGDLINGIVWDKHSMDFVFSTEATSNEELIEKLVKKFNIIDAVVT